MLGSESKREEKSNAAMVYEARERHDTDMIKELGRQMQDILAGAGCDHAKTKAMEALGQIFQIKHEM